MLYRLKNPIRFIFLLLLFSIPAFRDSAAASDTLWSKEEVAVLRSLWLGSLPPLPKDPSNKYALDQKAAKLGEKLFFDKRLSKNRKISCATCHLKDYDFTEDMARAFGMGPTVRRTQPLIGAAYLPWFFWDGRADSLWAQALGPPENPNEHGVTRTLCARIISEHYRKDYEEVFGALPDFPEDVCPFIAKPDPEDKEAYAAWLAIPPGKAEEISRVYANMGKAIAAYERLIVPGPSRFDRYVATLLEAPGKTESQELDARELKGLRLFIGKGRCVRCHNGPLFTNNQFRKTGVYQPADLPPDRGRADGIKKVLANEFNCLGQYSDARKEDCVALKTIDTDSERYAGAFKVPSLRKVAERPPYMHAGQYWSLWEVLRFYGRIRPGSSSDPDLNHSGLTDDEIVNLEAFLHTLSGPLVVPDFGAAKEREGAEEPGHGHHHSLHD